MSACTKKRKAGLIGRNGAAFSTRSPLQKCCTTIKSAEGTRSMEIFLRDISKYEGEGDVVRLEVLEGIRSCPTLVNALLRCHERFVRIVASELTVSANAAQFKNENATTVLRIGEKQVQQALKELGMVDIYNEMIHIQAVGCTPNVVDVADMSNNKKRRNKSRSKQWTKEEILEQERLLASSKEKMLLGGD